MGWAFQSWINWPSRTSLGGWRKPEKPGEVPGEYANSIKCNLKSELKKSPDLQCRLSIPSPGVAWLAEFAFFPQDSSISNHSCLDCAPLCRSIKNWRQLQPEIHKWIDGTTIQPTGSIINNRQRQWCFNIFPYSKEHCPRTVLPAN